MLGLFQQAPSYKGPGQPAAGCGSGFLGMLLGWFGGRPPAYKTPPVLDTAERSVPSLEPGPDQGSGEQSTEPKPVTIVIRCGA